MTIPSNETVEKAKKGLAARRPGGESKGSNDFDLRGYLDHYGVSISKEKSNGQGMIYVLKECPFNREHNRGEAHVQIGSDGKLGFACKHNSCSSYRWRDFRAKISGEESLLPFMTGQKTSKPKNSSMSRDTAPSIGDLRLCIDMNVDPGQFFTAEQACRWTGAYTRDHKKGVYRDLGRMAQKGFIRKDKYKHGGFRKPLEISSYDLEGDIQEEHFLDITLPLGIEELIRFKRNQLSVIAGRYDAGKSAFLFHLMKLNYERYQIVHFSSSEWDLNAIKERMDELRIPRPHENIQCYPMQDGYEDLIPPEPCIVLVDYIRTNDSPYEIDRQFYRILENLHGGTAFAAIQKHPFIDKPTGGQFAVHAPAHVILLDKLAKKNAYICKIFKAKMQSDLEGLFRVFGFKEGGWIIPYTKNWKIGEIKWGKSNDTNDINDTKNDGVKGGGPLTVKDKYKEKKESTKERKEKTELDSNDQAHDNDFNQDISKDAQGQMRFEV
jgi:hypothetical protein